MMIGTEEGVGIDTVNFRTLIIGYSIVELREWQRKRNAPIFPTDKKPLAAKHIYDESSIKAERDIIITKEARNSDKKKYRGVIYSQPRRWRSNYTQIERQRNEPGRVSGQGFKPQGRVAI